MISDLPRAQATSATSASETGSANWLTVLLGTYRSISDDRVLAVAAGVTFYALLAIFPAIGAIVSLYGLFADGVTIRTTLESLSMILPGGAIEIIGDQIVRVASAGDRALSFSFLTGLAIAIWGANAGVKAIFDAINIAYGVRDDRGFFQLNLLSLAFTAGAIAFALLALVAVVIVPIAIAYLGFDGKIEALLRYGRWPLIWMVVAFGLALLYRFAPAGSPRRRWRWITWGSAGASLLWIAASVAFSWYAANFGSYNKTYGSLGAAIGFMTWLWISVSVVIIGAELDSEIETASSPESTQSRSANASTKR